MLNVNMHDVFVIHVSIVPRNRKHSNMLLKLGRCRDNDPILDRMDPTSRARKRYASSDMPKIFTDSYIGDARTDACVREINLPDILSRLGLNAQDPLSSVHYFDFCIYVLFPAACGVRMCFNCPHCNTDCSEPGQEVNARACQ